MFTSILKNVIKDIGKQPEEEIHKVRSRRVPSTRASTKREVGVHHPPGVEALQTPYYWDFMETFSCRQDQLLTRFPVWGRKF